MKPPLSALTPFLLLLGLLMSSAATANSLFELRTIDGEPARLIDHVGNGKWVLVMLWSTDCALCKQQKPAISAFHDRHKESSAEVVGITIDGYDALESIQHYLSTHRPSFPNLVGELPLISFNYQVATQERFYGTPTYLLFDPTGDLIANQPGRLNTEALERFIARRGGE